MWGRVKRENKFPPLWFCLDIFVCCLHAYMKQNKIFIRSHVLLLSGSLEYVSIIRFQVIKLKFLCEAFKNEKWKILAWYSQTKCGDITNEILNVAIDAERTLKCKWPKCLILHCLFKMKGKNHAWGRHKSTIC